MAAIAEEADKEYEDKKFWKNYYAGYKRLRAEGIAWAEYQGEVKLWETTLADGLEEWPNLDRSGSFDIRPPAGP